MNKRAYILLLLAFSAIPALGNVLAESKSYYPSQFYQSVEDGQRDSQLKRLLFEVLNSAHVVRTNGHDELTNSCSASGSKSCYQHVSLGYTQARKALFGELHLEKVGSKYAVRDAYCQHLSIPGDYRRNPPGPGQIPDPAVLNAEHTWPQSRFNTRFNKDLQKSDLHILFPVLAHANTSRSNNEFSEVSSAVSSPCPPSKRGYALRGSSQIYFEPPDAHKGNAARAVFYFSVRYMLPISPEEERSLKAWHRQDPVDDFERTRNDAIFAKQKVRNPFIDHPELVDLISDF